MNGAPSSRVAIWLAVGAGLLLVIGANAHLLYVAVTSEPECVAHLRSSEGARPGSYSAAESACSSQPEDRARTSE
jgi:hypothetical protein